VDRTGELQDENQKRALDAITDFVKRARDVGAEEIVAVATSAMRDARNGQEFVDRIKRETGVEPQIISGDREAELTFIGATEGRRLDVETVVVDLGGGSGEVIDAEGTTPRWAKALPIGSRRLTEKFIQSDPPTADQIVNVVASVRSQLQTLPAASPKKGIFAGGTAKVLPEVLGKPGPPAVLAPSDWDRLLTIIQGLTADALAKEYRLPDERAQVLAAGAAALDAIAEFYGLDEVTIAATGIREGMIIDLLRKQGRWA
jgi:exopolyphosphatase/guanosine-5'-triphosphate,3'-diphosphate pyrophosphatase